MVSRRVIEAPPKAFDHTGQGARPARSRSRTLRAIRKTSGRPTFAPGPCSSTRASAAQASATGRAVNSRIPAGAPARVERLDVLPRLAEVPPGEREDVGPRDAGGQVAPALGRVLVGVLEDVHELERLAERARARDGAHAPPFEERFLRVEKSSVSSSPTMPATV